VPVVSAVAGSITHGADFGVHEASTNAMAARAGTAHLGGLSVGIVGSPAPADRSSPIFEEAAGGYLGESAMPDAAIQGGADVEEGEEASEGAGKGGEEGRKKLKQVAESGRHVQ
jgi:hypothetical protein